MAKRKAELEQDVLAYEACIARAEVSLSRQNYDEALAHAVAAWEFVDGMMQFKSRFQAKQFDSIRCVEIVSTYAPLLFRKDVLDQLGRLLKSQRRIERNTAADLGHALATANRRLVDAHRLWNLIAQSGDTKVSDLESRLGGDQANWSSLVARWIELGVLERVTTPQSTETLVLASRVEEPCRGKCPRCGSIVRAAKRRLWDSQQCPKCRSEAVFCLLA